MTSKSVALDVQEIERRLLVSLRKILEQLPDRNHDGKARTAPRRRSPGSRRKR